MGVVALLLALIQFVLVGFGVSFPVTNQLHDLAFGFALLVLGLLLPMLPKLAVTPNQ